MSLSPGRNHQGRPVTNRNHTAYRPNEQQRRYPLRLAETPPRESTKDFPKYGHRIIFIFSVLMNKPPPSLRLQPNLDLLPSKQLTLTDPTPLWQHVLLNK